MSQPAGRERLVVEHERLRVEQTQTQDLTTDEARERAKRMTEIEAELAKLNEESDVDDDDSA